MKEDHAWIDRHAVNYAYEKYKYKLKEEALQRERDAAAAGSSNVGGRPQGSTKESKRETELRLIDCKNAITKEYASVVVDAKVLGATVRVGYLKQLIHEKKLAYGVPPSTKIPNSTIYSRMHRQKTEVYGLGPETPMRDCESQLVNLIIKMSRIRRCLTPSQCLYLANDLIAGTAIEKK